jgi:Na+/proline symporter
MDMGIGAGILLIVAGAIMTFALNVSVQGIDLHMVGWIFMLAGLAGLALFFIFWSRRRSARAVETEGGTYEVGQPRV